VSGAYPNQPARGGDRNPSTMAGPQDTAGACSPGTTANAAWYGSKTTTTAVTAITAATFRVACSKPTRAVSQLPHHGRSFDLVHGGKDCCDRVETPLIPRSRGRADQDVIDADGRQLVEMIHEA
jgi:hypothetical protein